MFYLTSKFHDNHVNTFGFMEGAFDPPPPGPGTPKKPKRNRVNTCQKQFVIAVIVIMQVCSITLY